MKKWISGCLAVFVMSASMGMVTPNYGLIKTTVGQSMKTQVVAPTSKTKVFVDSAGRKVTVPSNISKIAISGPLAQIFVFSLAPDKLVGVSSKWSNPAKKILAPKYTNLPELGQLYGGKGELNLETLLKSGAQVVIDIGEPKDSIVTDMNELQKKTGIPFIHITANLDNMGDAYRQLGKLLNMSSEAEKRAKYCEKIYSRTKVIASKVKKAKVLYCVGDKGLNVIAKGSFHAQVLDLLADNVAVVENPVSKGSGNEVDMEQILKWNPDVIFFAPESIYSTVKKDPSWQNLKAIRTGKYYEVPEGPYNWMGFPPSVQRYLGMMWAEKVLYPQEAKYDLYQETATYFKLFYHSNLTKTQYRELVAHSIGQ